MQLRSTKSSEQAIALHSFAYAELSDAGMKSKVLPFLEGRHSHEPQLIGLAARHLGMPGKDRAIDPLLGALTEGRMVDEVSFDLARAFGRIGDPRAISSMTAVIAADNRYEAVYGVGHFGLAELTGVPYDSSHDRAYWTAWRTEKRHRFPPSVQGMPVPVLSLRH